MSKLKTQKRKIKTARRRKTKTAHRRRRKSKSTTSTTTIPVSYRFDPVTGTDIRHLQSSLITFRYNKEDYFTDHWIQNNLPSFMIKPTYNNEEELLLLRPDTMTKAYYETILRHISTKSKSIKTDRTVFNMITERDLGDDRTDEPDTESDSNYWSDY
jgi:hypothetical protein